MAAARIVLCLFFCTTRAHSNVDIISEPRPGQEYVLVSSGQQTPLRQLESSHNIPEKHSLSLSLKHDGVDEKSRKNLHKPMEKHPKEAIIYIDEDKKSSFGNGQRVEASETLEIDIPVSKLKDIEIKETVKDKVITPKIGDALEALSEFDNSNNKLATQALKPVLTTEPPSATKGFNYIPISFDIIDDINSGLFSSNIHLESAGSEQKQHSRIQIKKGPNGQDYEYEYVYYYFDDDNKRDAKDIQEKISSTTAAPVHNTHDGPPNVDTEAQMFMNQYNTINRSETSTATDENQNEVVLTVSRNQQRGPIMAPSPVDEIIVEDRLPSSTRFPPRNHNFDVSSMMTSLSQVSSEAANHYRLHQTDNIADESSEHTRSRTHQHVRRPSSELVDLVSFKTYSGDVPLQYKEPPSRYISESKATTEIPVTAPTVRKPVQNKASHREPHTFQEILDVSKLPTVYKFNSTENTTEHTTMTFMGKVALDLYAYLARENLNNEVSGFVNADAFTATDDKGYTAKVLTTEESKTTTTPVPKATMSIIVSPLTRPLRSRSQLGVRGRIPTFTGGTIEAPQEISNNTRGKTPAELFFKRQFRDKLPSTLDTEFAIVDLEVKDKDTEMKAKGKEYADRKRRAVESDIGQGEKVYVKNMIKENKLTNTFNDVPHTVVRKQGNDVELENDDSGQRLRRNIVHLKKVEGKWTVSLNENQKEQHDLSDDNVWK